jgi:hypothetical protein
VIIGSISFVLVAAGLLVAGLVSGESTYYYLSIVASALAALALVAGVRQIASRRSAEDDFDVRPIPVQRPGPAIGHVAVPHQIGTPEPARVAAGLAHELGAEGRRPDPPDEPAPQSITAVEAGRVAKLVTEVAVIDNRPRYHITHCSHLLGREYERLPAMEAVALGFTPCGACEPVTVLLAGVPRP